MAEEGKVGEASVDIIANIVVDEESLTQAGSQIQAALGKDATPRTEKRGGGKQTVDVDAKVKTVGNISKDIQAAIDKDEYQLTIDTASIRRQIEVALQKPFEITLATNIAGVGAQHGATVTAGAPLGRGAVPDDVRSAMWHQGKKGGREQYAFVDAIDNVYRNINDALKAAGQRVGTHGTEPGNQAEKLAELMDRFGNKVSEWVETAGPIGMPTGKGTMVEALKEAGVGMQDPNVQALVSNVGGFGGDNKRAAEIFAKRVYDWAQATPMRAAPAAEQQPQAQVRPTRAAPDPAIMQLIQAQEAAVEASRKAVTEERQASLTFTPIGPETTAPFEARPFQRGRGHTPGTGTPGIVDFEAEARARRELDADRANVRRLRGPGGALGGISLEPFLRVAEAGQFQDIFERFTGGKQGVSQGLFRADAGTTEGFDELTALGRRKPGRKFAIAGQEGKFATVQPSEALRRAFIEATGAPDAAAEFLDSPENRELIRKATLRGGRPLSRVAGETKRGQGAPTLAGARMPRPGGALDDIEQAEVIHTSDASEFSEASRRFNQLKANRRVMLAQRRDLQKKIDAANAEEEKSRAEAGVIPGIFPAGERAKRSDKEAAKTTTRSAYRRMKKLTGADEALFDELEGNRIEMEILKAREPGLRQRRRREAESLRAMDASERARSGPAQREIERGRSLPQAGDAEFVAGRSANERRDVALQRPEAQGRFAADLLEGMGLRTEEMSPSEVIEAALNKRYAAMEGRVTPRGEVLTGQQAKRQAAFGPTGKARRTVNEDEDAGVYGELVSQLPADLGRASRKTATSAISTVLSSLLETDKAARLELEKTLVAKEGMTRGVLPGRTTASAIATDEGIQRLAFDRTQTGEGLFLDAPGLRGARAAQLERNRRMEVGVEPKPPEESEFPYEDPTGFGQQAKADARAATQRLLLEREKADLTRQRTLGRGRGGLTGDETMKLAREAGLAEEEAAPEGLPFTAFSQKYGGGREIPGGGGGEGGGGDWSRLMGGGGGQAIPVYVTGGRLDSIGSGGGGGGRGRGRPTAEQGPEPEKETYKPATLPADRKIGAVERAMERDFVSALRGQNDPRARAAFEKRSFQRESQYLAGGAPSAAERDFLGALQRTSVESGRAAEERRERAQEAELKRQRRVARVNDPIGFAAERDIADTDLSGLRGENRALQRRVPRRGFGASITDLVTSMVGRSALEDQLEAADRAQRELNEINQAAEKRSGFITQRRGAVREARQLPQGDARRLGLLEQANELKQAARAQTEIIKTSTRVFEENAKVVRANTGKAFGAAAAGSVVSTAIGAFTFGLGSVVAAPIIEGIGTVFMSGLEKLLGDPQLKAATRQGFAEATRSAAGRADIGVAQVAAQAGLSGESLRRLAPELERTAAIEAGNKALEQQIGIFKLAEETRARGAEAGVTQTMGGLLGTPIGGTMPAAEQIGNFLGGAGVGRIGARGEELLGQGGRAAAYARNAMRAGADLGGADALVGDLDKFRERLQRVNEVLGKSTTTVVRFAEGTDFSREALMRQADELDEAGAPQLAALVRSQVVGITGQGGQLATGKDALADITDALIQASKPSVDTLLRQTADERRAQVWLQNQQRELSLRTVQPQTEAIALAGQGFGTGGEFGTQQTAAAGINLGGLSTSDQKRLNAELADTQKLYDQINKDVDTGIKAAKDFVSAAFPEDATVGLEFAKSLDLAAGYGREIASIQIGVQTKQAAFSAAQFAYQINIAKRSLADAKGLAGQLTGESKNNLGVLEREQFFLQRRAQMLQLELSQRQINFQRSVAGFTAPGLTGEERAARIQQAKIEADYAQKQLNIQKQLFGLGGKQFTIQASRQVQDLVGQLGLLERGRVLNVETSAAEKRIKGLTALQEKENKKVQTFYEGAIARTNDIMTVQAQMVAATGEALTTITNQVISAFRRTYASIRDVMSGTSSQTDDQPGKAADDRVIVNALGGVGTVNGETSLGNVGVMGEAGGEAWAILRAPKNLNGMISPLGGGGGQTTIQIVVSGNKFTSEDEEDRVMRKLTQAVKDAQDRDFALRGLRN